MLNRKLSGNGALVVIIGVFAALAAQTAAADKERHVSLRFAADLIENLEQTNVDIFGVPTGTGRLALIRGKAKGNLGRADMTAVGKSENVFPQADSRCPDGFSIVAEITDNNLVFTFSDLSLLYGDGQGVICVNFGTGEQYVAVEGAWLGGTARFRNASGEFSIRFDEYAVVSPNTQVAAEAGTITGTLSLGE